MRKSTGRVSAAAASESALRLSNNNALQVVNAAGIDAGSKYKMEFGRFVKRGGIGPINFEQHAGVTIKLYHGDKKSPTFFLLHLITQKRPNAEAEKQMEYTCTCGHMTSVDFKLFSEHMALHRNKGELNYKIENDGKQYSIMEQLCKSLFTDHLRLRSEVVYELKYLHDPKEVIADTKMVPVVRFLTMRQVLATAEAIILNFGVYVVFYWNCQDFSTWFMTNVGISLHDIHPTLTDHITGSGTESSARKVQELKSSLYYMQTDEQEKFDLQFQEEVYAVCPDCDVPFTDDMSFQRHRNICFNLQTYGGAKFLEGNHKEHKIHGGPVDDVLTGKSCGLNLSGENRRYNVYVLSGSSVDGHMSLVFQPYATGPEPQPLEYFHTVELIQNTTRGLRFASGELSFRDVTHLKEKFIERQTNYTIEGITYFFLHALVSEVYGKSMFRSYESLMTNCEAFCKGVNSEILQRCKTIPNGREGDPFENHNWMTKIRKIVLTSTSVLISFPLQATLMALVLAFPPSVWLATAYVLFVWYRLMEGLPKMKSSHELLSTSYTDKLIKHGVKILPYLKVVSFSVLALQSLFDDVNGTVRILFFLSVWNGLIAWYEQFGTEYGTMIGSSAITVGRYSYFPRGPKLRNVLAGIVASTVPLDLIICLVFLTGQFLFISLGMPLVLVCYLVFDGFQADKVEIIPFVQAHLHEIVSVIVLSAFPYNQPDELWTVQVTWELLIYVAHALCMISYCLIAWYMHTEDCCVSSGVVTRKASHLFGQMTKTGLFDTDLNLFNVKGQGVVESAVFLHNTLIPRLIVPASKRLKLLIFAYMLTLVVSGPLCWRYGSLWLLLALVSISTWVVAMILTVLMSLYSSIAAFISQTTGQGEVTVVYRCSMWQVGCPDPIFKLEQNMFVCTKCSKVKDGLFMAFCENCHRKGCSGYHPFYVMKVKSNWSTFDRLQMATRKSLPCPEPEVPVQWLTE